MARDRGGMACDGSADTFKNVSGLWQSITFFDGADSGRISPVASAPSGFSLKVPDNRPSAVFSDLPALDDGERRRLVPILNAPRDSPRRDLSDANP